MKKHHKVSLTSQFSVAKNLQLIVVIPCYNELDILKTLNSLAECRLDNFGVEIILLINSYHFNTDQLKAINKQTYEESLFFARNKNRPNFQFIPILIEDLPGNQSGAGLPRKLGMDEALARFDKIGHHSGIIVCLDADCTVEKNYLTEIYHSFKKYSLHSATIEFHHPTDHLPKGSPLREASILYELYLRYYREAMEYCGFPYPYYTIGSAMAVTSETYARVGGMGKQQAGEDFYFLQKIFPLGKTMFIDSTCVYPAARLSDRVPFGTGPELIKMVNSDNIIKMTYSLEAFEILKTFFEKIEDFFYIPESSFETKINQLPEPLQLFLKTDEFIKKLAEIKQNTANQGAFKKRFFSYFNAFKLVKYLNFIHPSYFPLKDLKEQYAILIDKNR